MDLDKNVYKKAVDNLYDGLYFVNKERIITYWNNAAERITGFTADEVIGRSCADNILTHTDIEGNSLCDGSCPLLDVMIDGNPRKAKVYLHHKDGHRLSVFARVSTITDKEGNIVGGVELFTDISNQEANELRVKELERLAFLDNLTRLANRNCIEREILNRLEEKKRFKVPFGILFIDVDDFKKINDKYGHHIGDKMLKVIGNTFIANSRSFDLYGRWGGEEFIGIIRNINRVNLGCLGNRLCLQIKNSYIIHDNERLWLTVSIGATLAHEDDNIDSLIKRADKLLYKSKTAGKNRLTMG